ncbi:hypothetical protein GH5_04224 [Leishmania sp. Ghana 2012 LV757]|uniref:hypothetical protein n=1 Tax=Leishmania sp. Ghana 2012 LV757 TaxID=2803181 RepID=UPI001B6FD745|nr:hypothetical protein GH5_04224 [Leishmania sp. Ghana 2012 LV757]
MLRYPAIIAGWRLYRSRCMIWAPPTRTVPQRRHCSTLGQIHSMLQTLRHAKRVQGGALRLCITEDMRVIVEHQPPSEVVAKALAHEVVGWQGTSSVTVREAVGHLHPSDELCRGESRPQLPVTTPVPMSSATIVDLSRVNSDELRGVMRFLEDRHPKLRLLVHHTSGRDLQGTHVHSASVKLVPRGMGVQVASLSDEEQHMAAVFNGEAVGESYLGCVRRALRDAFSAADLVYPSSSALSPTAVSVLSLYTEAWGSDGFSLHLMPSVIPKHVECSLRHSATGKSLASCAVALTSDGLRKLMKFCDDSTAEYYADRHASIQQRLRSAPLHLVLPRSCLRVKHLLRKLLLYYYGIAEEDVVFRAEMLSGFVHRAEVQARLQLSGTVNGADGPLGIFVLGKATGSSKSSTVLLATVQALRTVFPDVFEREIAYHPEVRAILESSKATLSDDVAPHPGQGLEKQLRWALQRQNASFTLETLLLKPNATLSEWGIATKAKPVWVSQLYIVGGSPDAAAADATAAGATTSCDLVCCAFDSRKARSEQKALAAALAQRFPDLCHASVKQARENKLIDAGGAPVPCVEVQPLQDASTNLFTTALSSDPFLKLLLPRKSTEPQSLPLLQSADSALERYWCATKAHTSFLGSIRVMREASRAVYVARCTMAGGTYDALERVIAEATGSTEIGALFALVRGLQKLPEVVCQAASAEAADEARLVEALPSALPNASPLQTCAQAIARLYGLQCSVCLRQCDAMFLAELRGTIPVGSALCEEHSRFSTTPFAAGRPFYLGQGHGTTALVAVVRAAQQVFEVHIRAHHRAFDEEVMMRGQVRLQPDVQGSLGRLRDAVVDEIKSTSKRIVNDSWLLFNFEHHQVSDLSFCISSHKHTVVLEHVVGKNLLSCARELANRISHETSVAFLLPAHLSAVVAQTAEQLLSKLCLQAYGLTLQTDTCQRGQMWHCRLSVPISDEMAYCIAQASGLRKKDTVEAAAVAALREYFGEELPHIYSFAALPSIATQEQLNGVSGETPTTSGCEAYAFRVSKSSASQSACLF